MTAPWQERLATAVFGLGAHVRYVAFGDGQRISMSQRPELESASAEESDFYEELLVNPAVLELTRRRGELDCGGLEFVVVGYGNSTKSYSRHRPVTSRSGSKRAPSRSRWPRPLQD